MSPDFERLVGRAILNPDFRKRLLDDPDGTVKDEGFTISGDELEELRKAAADRAGSDQKLDGIGVRALWH